MGLFTIQHDTDFSSAPALASLSCDCVRYFNCDSTLPCHYADQILEKTCALNISLVVPQSIQYIRDRTTRSPGRSCSILHGSRGLIASARKNSIIGFGAWSRHNPEAVPSFPLASVLVICNYRWNTAPISDPCDRLQPRRAAFLFHMGPATGTPLVAGHSGGIHTRNNARVTRNQRSPSC